MRPSASLKLAHRRIGTKIVSSSSSLSFSVQSNRPTESVMLPTFPVPVPVSAAVVSAPPSPQAFKAFRKPTIITTARKDPDGRLKSGLVRGREGECEIDKDKQASNCVDGSGSRECTVNSPWSRPMSRSRSRSRSG